MEIKLAAASEIDSWMELVERVKDNFPGLETKEAMEEHRNTVLDFMSRESAICAKINDKVVGTLLFSKEDNMLCFLAVDREYRRQHIGEKMVSLMLTLIGPGKDIAVTTYREGVPEGIAARAFYKKIGFREGRLTEEFGSLVQEFILKQSKRGSVKSDVKDFSEYSVQKLKKASGHIRYLINEGYSIKSASTFVGNHFLLSERQRLALVRSISTDEQLRLRKEKECVAEELIGKTVHIDGFNTIITLEIALCQSLLLECMDGTIRDLAGLRGTYRLIEATSEAVRLIADSLEQIKVEKAVFYLDAPVSNSGRLKNLIADVWENYAMELDIQVINDVDRKLQENEYVITADAMILDKCKSWFNLTRLCVEKMKVVPVKVWEVV